MHLNALTNQCCQTNHCSLMWWLQTSDLDLKLDPSQSSNIKHPTFSRNPYNRYINSYYCVDDHPLLYGNNGSWSTLAQMDFTYTVGIPWISLVFCQRLKSSPRIPFEKPSPKWLSNAQNQKQSKGLGQFFAIKNSNISKCAAFCIQFECHPASKYFLGIRFCLL